MRKKDLARVRGAITRRATLQGLGTFIGATAVGCNSDDATGGSGGSTGEPGDTTSSSTTTGTSGSSTAESADASSSSGGSSSSDSSTSGGSSSDSGSDSSSEGTTGDVEACVGDGGLTPEELLAQVDHVVVIMMENRSFDHYFGSLQFVEGRNDVDGLNGNESNPTAGGEDIQVFEFNNFTPEDPPHTWEECHNQWNGGANDGFVREQEIKNPASVSDVMGYHVRDQLPVIHALADNYTLCDRWFASVMGPTWPNRFYLHAATSDSQMSNLPVFGVTKIWDILDDANIEGRNYYADLAWMWGGFANPLTGTTDSLDEFFTRADSGTLPAYSLIDPGFSSNDDHPDHDITLGQVFISTVYEALAQSPTWERTLLIITYDEHGGFYDHVPPPITVDDDSDFTQLGFRVPALVIGPHVRKGCINSTQMEHVSVISTLTTRFGLPSLNRRVSATNDVSSCINPDYLDDPQPPAPVPVLDVSVEKMMEKVGKTTSQKELWDAIDSGRVKLPPGADKRGEIRETTLRLLHRAEQYGVVRLRP